MKRYEYLRPLIMATGILIVLTYFVRAQNDSNPYHGLNNENMVETLKNFPRKPARWNVPAEDGRLLYDLIKRNGYKRVLEIGTSNGYSALWMGFALQETGGELITIEINQERGNEARKNIDEAGLSSLIDVRISDALDEIPEIKGNFDSIFLDADKSEYMNYFNMLKPRLNINGAVSAHNVSNMKYAMQDFLKAIRNDPDFEVKIRQVSNQGVLVATKKSEND
jgi:predicted O-methyltransferase YrrM